MRRRKNHPTALGRKGHAVADQPTSDAMLQIRPWSDDVWQPEGRTGAATATQDETR